MGSEMCIRDRSGVLYPLWDGTGDRKRAGYPFCRAAAAGQRSHAQPHDAGAAEYSAGRGGGNHGSDRKGNGTFARKRRIMLHKEKGAFWLPFLRGVGLIAATAAAVVVPTVAPAVAAAAAAQDDDDQDDPQAAVISTSTSVAIASPSATAAEEKNDPYAGRHSAATSTVIHRISTSAVCCT